MKIIARSLTGSSVAGSVSSPAVPVPVAEPEAVAASVAGLTLAVLLDVTAASVAIVVRSDAESDGDPAAEEQDGDDDAADDRERQNREGHRAPRHGDGRRRRCGSRRDGGDPAGFCGGFGGLDGLGLL